MKILIVLMIVNSVLISCASKLNRNKKIKNQGQSGEVVDLSKLTFFDAISDDQFSVADYVEQNDVKFLLLMFGSVGCSACNKKAKLLSENYIGQHELLLNRRKNHLDFIGVNTDSGAARNMFKSIMLNDSERELRGYGFIGWSDPQGQTMRNFLLPPDKDFGVPFTVMLEGNVIKWRYYNDETYELDELFERIEATIEGEDVKGKTTDDDDKEELPPPPTDSIPENLEPLLKLLPRPDRFVADSVITCSGEIKSLQDIISDSDLWFLQLNASQCNPNSPCGKNHQIMQAIGNSCGSGKTCRFLTIKTHHDLTGKDCERSHIVKGEPELLKAFATRFNWRWPKYEPETDEFGGPVGIPEIDGPVILGFDKHGELVFDWDEDDSGLLEAKLRQAIGDTNAGNIALPDFKVYGGSFRDQSVRTRTFDQILRQSHFTVLGSFDFKCIACIEELSHWSEDKGDAVLLNYCKNRPDFCQVYALETESTADQFDVNTDEEFYNKIIDQYFSPKKIGVPLLIDQENFSGYPRIFHSYLRLYFDRWQGYGIVIYDREGKIVADFLSQGPVEPDPVLETLKLFEGNI